MHSKFVASLIVSILVAGGLGFFGGMTYQKQQAPAGRAGFGANGGRGPGQGFAGGQGQRLLGGANGAGGFSNGEIVSKDATGMTLKLMDGGSKVVLFASSTRIGKTSEGSLSDLNTGTNVMVNGTANSDGSITAAQIQIRPAGEPGMFMLRGGQRDTLQTPTPNSR